MIIMQLYRFIILLYLLQYYPVIFWGIVKLRIYLCLIILITIIMRPMERIEVNIVELFLQNQLIRFIYFALNL